MAGLWVLRFCEEMNTIDLVPEETEIPMDEFYGFDGESSCNEKGNCCSNSLHQRGVRYSHRQPCNKLGFAYDSKPKDIPNY